MSQIARVKKVKASESAYNTRRNSFRLQEEKDCHYRDLSQLNKTSFSRNIKNVDHERNFSKPSTILQARPIKSDSFEVGVIDLSNFINISFIQKIEFSREEPNIQLPSNLKTKKKLYPKVVHSSKLDKLNRKLNYQNIYNDFNDSKDSKDFDDSKDSKDSKYSVDNEKENPVKSSFLSKNEFLLIFNNFTDNENNYNKIYLNKNYEEDNINNWNKKIIYDILEYPTFDDNIEVLLSDEKKSNFKLEEVFTKKNIIKEIQNYDDEYNVDNVQSSKELKFKNEEYEEYSVDYISNILNVKYKYENENTETSQSSLELINMKPYFADRDRDLQDYSYTNNFNKDSFNYNIDNLNKQ